MTSDGRDEPSTTRAVAAVHGVNEQETAPIIDCGIGHPAVHGAVFRPTAHA